MLKIYEATRLKGGKLGPPKLIRTEPISSPKWEPISEVLEKRMTQWIAETEQTKDPRVLDADLVRKEPYI